MAEHVLKVHEMPFAALASGAKTGEIRVDDRGFQVGDTVLLQEVKAQMAEPVAWIAKGRNGVIVELCLPAPDDERITLDWAPLYAAPPAAQDVSGLVEALEHARLFIRNGIELGYIKMPEADTPDPAHDTLPKIDKALAAHRKAQQHEVEQCPKS